MNKRELAVKNILLKHRGVGNLTNFIPVNIVVKDNKEKDGFIVYEIWDSNSPNKPFIVLNLKYNISPIPYN